MAKGNLSVIGGLEFVHFNHRSPPQLYSNVSGHFHWATFDLIVRVIIESLVFYSLRWRKRQKTATSKTKPVDCFDRRADLISGQLLSQ